MLKKREAFLKILCIELEDLKEDINLLIDESDKRFCNDEISNYVFLENIALLKNELFGVDSFLEDIKNINAMNYDNLDIMIKSILNNFESRIHEKGIAHSIINLIDRKINKVKLYVKS